MTDSNSGSTAENRPYLGDPQIIAKLLQNIARETIQCRVAAGQSILSPGDAQSIEEKEATNAARALLGRDRKYAVDTNWNVPGVIDNFVKDELKLQGKGSEPILVEGLLKFIQEIHQRLGLLDSPKQDPKAEARVQDIIEKYQNLLLGLSISAPATSPASESPAVAPAPAPTPTRITSFVEPLPVVPPPQPAPKAPARVPEPVAAAPVPKPRSEPKVTEFPEPKRSGGNLKWAAIIILLLLLAGGTTFLVMKPSKAPEPEIVVAKPAPPPKIVSVAPVLNHSGTIDLLDGEGKTTKTISMKDGQKIGHLYDFVRINGSSSFLVATESTKETYDLWLLDESGEGRKVNDAVLDAKLSSDAAKVAYTTGNHTLVVEEADGKPIATADGAFEVIWSPDNQSVIFLKVRDGYATTHPDAMELSKLSLEGKSVETVVTGLYDNVMPIMQPEGKFILMVAGRETGLPSFWKLPKDSGQPIQITNVRLDETNAAWVPTPFSTAQWSADGRWLLYDFKDGTIEQIWGMEFDEAGNVKRSTRITDGLVPRWIGNDKFVCLKAVNGSFEASVQSAPGL